jgi:hypothetical protein
MPIVIQSIPDTEKFLYWYISCDYE